MNKPALAVIALAAVMLPDLAAGQVSVKRGKELFNSTSLGTNQKSCATCHPDGSKLQRAASYKEQRLAGIINLCIRNMLRGEPLPPGSDDMASMISYLRTLDSPPGRPARWGE